MKNKTNSQKFWLSVALIGYLICGYISIYSVYYMVDVNTDFTVPVQIVDKFQQGYHTKHGVGEDLYIVAYNKKYGNMNIRVSYNTYVSSKIGESTAFDLDKNEIRRYGGNINVNDWVVIGLTMGVFWGAFTIYLLIEHIIIPLVKNFNNFLDSK